jgi:hypothetical protein
MKKECKAPGEIITISGKQYCVGEKIVSKWKHSKLNKKTKKRQGGNFRKTRRTYV